MAVAYTSDHRHHHHHHDVVGRLSSLVALCGRGLSRASRRLLLLDRRCYGGGGRAAAPAKQDGGGEAIWQRTILMGERCQPLDFDGAVHYDSFGRRMAAPRSASSLSSCCSSDSLGAATSEASYITSTSTCDDGVL